MWILITILILLTLGLIALIINRKRLKQHKVNKDALFTMGLVFFALGVISESFFFIVLGLAYIAIGVSKNEKK